MKIIIVFLVLTLSGCASINQGSKEGQMFKEITKQCDLLGEATTYGLCLETGLNSQMPNWRDDVDAGYVNSYIAWLKAAGERVGKGTMQTTDFWESKIELLNRLQAQAKSNRPQQPNDNNLALFLTGLALLNSANPAPTYAPNTYIPQPIRCTTQQIGTSNNYTTNCF